MCTDLLKTIIPVRGRKQKKIADIEEERNLLLKITIPVRGRNNIFLYERRMSMSYVYLTEENVKLQKKGGRYLVGRSLEIVMEIPE